MKKSAASPRRSKSADPSAPSSPDRRRIPSPRPDRKKVRGAGHGSQTSTSLDGLHAWGRRLRCSTWTPQVPLLIGTPSHSSSTPSASPKSTTGLQAVARRHRSPIPRRRRLSLSPGHLHRRLPLPPHVLAARSAERILHLSLSLSLMSRRPSLRSAGNVSRDCFSRPQNTLRRRALSVIEDGDDARRK